MRVDEKGRQQTRHESSEELQVATQMILAVELQRLRGRCLERTMEKASLPRPRWTVRTRIGRSNERRGLNGRSSLQNQLEQHDRRKAQHGRSASGHQDHRELGQRCARAWQRDAHFQSRLGVGLYRPMTSTRSTQRASSAADAFAMAVGSKARLDAHFGASVPTRPAAPTRYKSADIPPPVRLACEQRQPQECL